MDLAGDRGWVGDWALPRRTIVLTYLLGSAERKDRWLSDPQSIEAPARGPPKHTWRTEFNPPFRRSWWVSNPAKECRDETSEGACIADEGLEEKGARAAGMKFRKNENSIEDHDGVCTSHHTHFDFAS